MVIFAGEKLCENVGNTFHVGVIFTILPSFFHKVIGVLFSRCGNFGEEDKSAKNEKLLSTRKFPHLQ